MAQRRMFSKDITEHDSFLDMPPSAQALYFHLGMQADDDGFVSPNRVSRMIGSSVDDLKILISKRFVIPFQSGVCVVKHWKINNYIQKDRYKPTKYVDEKNLLFTKENGSYTDCIQNVRVGKVRLGKESNLGETSSPEKDSPLIENKKQVMSWNKHPEDFEEQVVDLEGDGTATPPPKRNTRKYPNAPKVRKIFQEVLGRNPANWRVNKTQLQACENLSTERGLDKIKSALLYYQENKEDKFCPTITSPYDLDSKWTKLGEHKIKKQ